MLRRKDLKKMSKAELHCHLDGSVRFKTIVSLAKYHNIDLGAASESELRRKTRITFPMKDLSAVLETFWIAQKVLCSYEAIIEGVLDGITAGMEKYPVQVGLIMILPRTFDLGKNRAATEDILRYLKSHHRSADRICGFDLTDAEAETDPEDFVPLIYKARLAGLGITIHSGENADAGWVERTLELYEPQRIGHGIKIWRDERVMEMVREKEVMLEVCFTSNWLTSCVSSLGEHPLPHLFRSGVLVSINSDDPQLAEPVELKISFMLCFRAEGKIL